MGEEFLNKRDEIFKKYGFTFLDEFSMGMGVWSREEADFDGDFIYAKTMGSVDFMSINTAENFKESRRLYCNGNSTCFKFNLESLDIIMNSMFFK